MNDHKVYVIGLNDWRKLRLGDITISALTEIPELSGKGIEEFYKGNLCMFARSSINEIYSWGHNKYGKLGRGFESYERLKAEKIDFFDDKNIIDIKNGTSHSLALSYDGKVYGWGDNEKAQVDLCQPGVKCVCVPLLIDFKVPIKFIHCQDYNSFAVDITGNAYYWGEYVNQITPKKMIIKGVKKIQKNFIYFIVLKENGDISINDNSKFTTLQ